jgi:hypothetical protein
MKKVSVIFLPLLVLLFIAPATFALDRGASSNVTLPSGETVNHDYFATGNTVEIAGTVNGDVYAVGGQILVDGVINGDLITAGGIVNVTGKVNGNVRAAGGQVSIEGTVGKNMTLAGGNVTISSAASTHGNLVAAGGNLNLEAPVPGTVTAAGGNLTVSNQIGSDITAMVGTLRLTSNAKVAGDLNYTSRNDAMIDPGAKVSGKLTKNTPLNTNPSPFGTRIVFDIFALLSTILSGLLLLRFSPSFTEKAVQQIVRRPWASLGLGFASLFLVPIGIVILMITIVGIPLAFVSLSLYLVSLYLALLLFILWGGTWIDRLVNLKLNRYLIFVLGAVAFWLLSLIPFVGGLVVFFGLMLGLGAYTLSLRQNFPILK